MGGGLFVAALQTVSLNKVFEIFRPEQIREIIGNSNFNDEKITNRDEMLGLEIMQIKNNVAKMNYSSEASPFLTDIEVKKIKRILKNAGINDLIVTNLSVEIQLEPKRFNSNGKETNYLAEFRNERCPNSEAIRNDLKEKNEKLYFLNKQFRYRQLILDYLIGKSQIGTVPRASQKPIIQLKTNWQRKFTLNFGDEGKLSSSKTIDEVQLVLGNYCVKENFRQHKNKEWEIIGHKFI